MLKLCNLLTLHFYIISATEKNILPKLKLLRGNKPSFSELINELNFISKNTSFIKKSVFLGKKEISEEDKISSKKSKSDIQNPENSILKEENIPRKPKNILPSNKIKLGPQKSDSEEKEEFYFESNNFEDNINKNLSEESLDELEYIDPSRRFDYGLYKIPEKKFNNYERVFEMKNSEEKYDELVNVLKGKFYFKFLEDLVNLNFLFKEIFLKNKENRNSEEVKKGLIKFNQEFKKFYMGVKHSLLIWYNNIGYKVLDEIIEIEEDNYIRLPNKKFGKELKKYLDETSLFVKEKFDPLNSEEIKIHKKFFWEKYSEENKNESTCETDMRKENEELKGENKIVSKIEKEDLFLEEKILKDNKKIFEEIFQIKI